MIHLITHIFNKTLFKFKNFTDAYNVQVNQYYIIMLMTCTFLLACTPPHGWDGNPYIRASFSSKKYHENSNIIRVQIYKGNLIPIKTPSTYAFVTDKGTSTGKKIISPKVDGLLKPNKNLFKIKGKVYLGDLKIVKNNNHYLYINYLPVSEYLISVLGHEMNNSWPLETLKAQAIIARTYMYTAKLKNRNKPYDLASDTSYQVYKGILKYDKNLRKAVTSTKLKILTYNNKLAQVFFHSSCGSSLASASELWGNEEIPYLKSKRSNYCIQSPAYKWNYQLPLSTIENKFNLKNITSLKIAKRTISKRVDKVLLKSNTSQKVVDANKFRSILGNEKFKSTLFKMSIKNHHIYFEGRGFGHGVGMCQWGAKFMVEKYKKRYKDVIKHYFPNTKIQNIHTSLLASL